jgi:mannosyltransferase OCH1-like enzyme
MKIFTWILIIILAISSVVISILSIHRREKYENVERIPRIIHQCYLGIDNPNMPKKWADNHQKWKDMHPGWEVKLWNGKSSRRLIEKMDPNFLKTYDNFPHWVQKADAVRSFILKKYGGVYVDLDTYPKHSIENILAIYEVSPKIEVMMGGGSGLEVYSNWLMISKKNSGFWDLTIKNMKKKPFWSKISKHTQIIYTTGPMMVSAAAKKYGTEKVVVIDKKLLTNCTTCDSKKKCEQNSLYIVNGNDSSWHSNDSSFFNKIYCAFKKT